MQILFLFSIKTDSFLLHKMVNQNESHIFNLLYPLEVFSDHSLNFLCFQREMRVDQLELLHLVRNVVFSDEDMVVPDAPFQVHNPQFLKKADLFH
jgi:hypothetical protein